MRRDLVAAVRSKRFVAVCHGVTDAILPGLNTSNVPHVNMVPTGPHPAGSYEVWAPREYLADLLSFMLIRREVTRHSPSPRSAPTRVPRRAGAHDPPPPAHRIRRRGPHRARRHSRYFGADAPLTIRAATTWQGRATFFGPPMRINLNALSDGGDPAQYPELGLGYSAMTWPTAARA